MKPAPFKYHRPDSLDEAIHLLRTHEDSRVLAGGQSLVPMMNLRVAQPENLVDVNFILELDRLEIANGDLRIGASVTQHMLLNSPKVLEHFSLLNRAVSFVGYPATRHRGTVVGSAAHADPAAEIPAALLALDACFEIRGESKRIIPAESFFVDYYTTAVSHGEMVETIRVPGLSADIKTCFLEFSRRYHDFPICGVAIKIDASGETLSGVRIALAGAGPRPMRAKEGEAILEGEVPSLGLFEAVAERVSEEVEPIGDVHGSAEYRRKIARELTRRALKEALIGS